MFVEYPSRKLRRRGFGRNGPIKNTYASTWQSELGDVPRNHRFCYYQREGMKSKDQSDKWGLLLMVLVIFGIISFLIQIVNERREQIRLEAVRREKERQEKERQEKLRLLEIERKNKEFEHNLNFIILVLFFLFPKIIYEKYTEFIERKEFLFEEEKLKELIRKSNSCPDVKDICIEDTQ